MPRGREGRALNISGSSADLADELREIHRLALNAIKALRAGESLNGTSALAKIELLARDGVLRGAGYLATNGGDV